MPHRRVVELYERHSAAWARDRGTSLIERPWLDRLTAGLTRGATILDIGCGSGFPIAHHLLDRGFAVTGIDASPAMIEMCRARLPEGEWIVADMRALDLGRTFHALVAWDSFFHLTREDQRDMFPRFKAHAAPGTGLMFTSGPHDGESFGEYRGEPLYHASLSAPEYRRLLARNGFSVEAHVESDPGCGSHTVWLARYGAF